MATTILTLDDLQEFKKELLQEINKIALKINPQKVEKTKRWIKSNEVMEKLDISPGTLQNLRINGTLPYTKLGGVLYYDSEEIEKVLTENKIDNSL